MSNLFSELRRRKVFRTAAAYLAAAFVVLQVADLTFEPLGLSPELYRGLVLVAGIGFPVAILLSWFVDLRRESIRASHAATAAVIAFVILCGAALAYGVTRHWQRAGEDRFYAIAVLPFNVFGDPQLSYLTNGMAEMISRNVDGAARLRAIPAEMVKAAAEKDKTEANIAKQLRARYVVSGNVARAGNQLRVTLSVFDFRGSEPKLVRHEVGGSPDDLLQIVDRVSAYVLSSTRSGADAALSASAAKTTTSLPALRAYLQGEDFYRRTDYDSAVARFSEAVAHDSTFALAYYRLALSHLGVGSLPAARAPIETAMRYHGRLAEHDRTRVEILADAMNGRVLDAIDNSNALLKKYPNDLEVLYNLGTLIQIAYPRHGRPLVESAEPLARVIAADPEFLCPI